MEQDPNPESPPPPEDDAPAPAPAGSGFYYKDGREIPPTHPDHGPMHLLPRQEDGSFAAYYYCSKAELYDMQVPGPPPRRHRRDGFTLERQEQFLDLIRGGASGREAARKVGISPTTAYNLYNSRDGAAFRAGWDEAARATDIVLEDTAFDRAVNGQEEPVFFKGERVGTRWKYDNALLMRLLRARLPLKYAPLSEIEGWLRQRGVAPPADADGALDRLHAAEAEWESRLPGEPAPARLGRAPAGRALPASVRAAEGGENAPDASTSSTSSDTGRPESAPDASTSSTSSDTGQPESAADPSMSSTSPDTEQPEAAAGPSMSSTSSAGGQVETAAEPSASSASSPAEREPPRPPSGPHPPAAEDPPNLFRPPPRPRIRLL